MIYLDNSATTKPCQQSINRINDALCENWGNPSSLYELGLNSELILDDTRKSVAKLIGCKSEEVYFTSGGTEANNLAIIGTATAKAKVGKRIVTTTIEHASVLEAVKHLEGLGFEVVRIKPDKQGFLKIDEFKAAINENTILVSVMLVNNETGCIFPVDEISNIIKQKSSHAVLHCDCVQAFGKMPLNVKKLGVDLLTASGHKIHGPKGVGILYKSERLHINPIIFGGNQEKGLRSGTEAVPLIAGLLGALEEINIGGSLPQIAKLHDYAFDKLSKLENVVINSPTINHLPYIINFSVKNIRSETVLHFLESEGIYVSSGSACSKGKGSYVLNEMGLDAKIIDSAIRISFSKNNTFDDIDTLCEKIVLAQNKLCYRK